MPRFAFLLLCIAAIAAAQEQDFSKVQIKVTKVSGNIYMLEGSGGNIAASVGEDGIVIVDDQYAPLADKIAAALKGIGVTDKPVRFVINTHYHGDHTGGNLALRHRGLDRHRAGQRAQAPGDWRQGRQRWIGGDGRETRAPRVRCRSSPSITM